MSRRFGEDDLNRGIAASDLGPTIHESLSHIINLDRGAARPALISGEHVVSYAELDAQAARLAGHLRKRGVGAGSRVGLALPASSEAVQATLGILKAGAVVVPLDPAAPSDRLAFIAEEAELTAVVSAASWRARQESDRPWAAPTILLDADAEAIARAPLAAPDCGGSAEDLAFIIYESGAVGRPKGVMVPHRAVVRLASAEFSGLGPSDAAALPASNFDPFAIWATLLSGAALCFAPSPTLDALERCGATAAWLSVAQFCAAMDRGGAAPGRLRHLFIGGVPSPEHLRRARDLLPGRRLVSDYGSLEVANFTCRHELAQDAAAAAAAAAAPAIGRPIAGAKAYVLDESLRPVASGQIGELFVAGEGVALGYLGQPELTADRFLPDRLAGDPGRRMYRTGDLVRQRADGVLELVRRSERDAEIARDAAERFWKRKLGDLREPSLLADAASGARGDRRANGPRAGGYGRLCARLDIAATDRLFGFARKERIAPKILMFGAWALLLRRYCGQRTVAFGAAAAEGSSDRQSAGGEAGRFDQIPPMIQSLRPDQSVGDWLRALRDEVLISPGPVPAALSLGGVRRSAGGAGQSLFDTIVIFDDRPTGAAARGGLDALAPLDAGATPEAALVLRAADEFVVQLFLSPRPVRARPDRGRSWPFGSSH